MIIRDLYKWFAGIFKDESGLPSSKRFVGIVCSLTLCITMYLNAFSSIEIAPAQYLVDAVALLAFGCLGLSSVDKFTKNKKDINIATSPNTSIESSITCTTCSQEPCQC